MKNLVMDSLRDLNISIKKKMFLIGKKNGIKNPPSPLQVRIFMYIYHSKDMSLSSADLARELKVSKVAIGEALTKMEQNGNIVIKDSETDGRKKILSYTDEGLRRMNGMLSSINSLNDELLKDISDDDLEIFINVVDKMKRNLEEE